MSVLSWHVLSRQGLSRHAAGLLPRLGCGLAVALGMPLLAALPLAAAPAIAQAPGEPVFVPHRAIYDLSLKDAKSGSGVAAVSGRIVYELTGSPCEGYAQSMRFVTVMTNQEGEGQTTDLRTSSWEDVPAKRLRFSTTTYQNERLSGQTQGAASREAGSGPAKLELKRPQKKTQTLPGDVYFPLQHSMAIIKAGHAGKSILTARFFDGSDDGEKVYMTSTAIGRELTEPVAASGGDTQVVGLQGVPSWPVQVSYYGDEEKRKDMLPVYEMSFRLHENGVTSRLSIDYGDFSVEGTLKSLTLHEPTTCK